MKLTLLLAVVPVLAATAACTPDRSLTTDSPYWPGEYRDGYNNGEYVSTLPHREGYEDSVGSAPSEKESDDLNN